MLNVEPLFTGVSMHNSSGLPSTPASVNGKCRLAFHQMHEQQVLNQSGHLVYMLTGINFLSYTLSNPNSCVRYYVKSN